ncbi:MAG TPA: SNF2-related protein, partial [Pirellulaceae bacterium]|nr:SNF2-related protein [Pirellulaceae bacterium]
QLLIRDANLDEVLGELSQSGWEIFAEGRVLRRPGKLSLSVNAGVDWFDLEGHVDFGEHRAQLPAILAALKEKRNYVRIKPGVDIEIPTSFRERLARLSDLGEATDGGVRFKSNQALLLDALLEAEQPHALTIDERFRDARGVAKQLGSMPSCSPPPSFKGELRPYQLEGLAWLEYLRRIGFGGCLADDMGLGKTIQILALLESRRVRTPTREDERRPSLIVVPKSLVFNWMQEAARFTPELKILNYTGSERRLDPQLFNEYDVVVTTYGTLRLDIPQLLDTNFDYAILDEAQAIKTASSQAAKACRLIRARHRLALTGTPVENHLGELWSIFEFINPGMLGQSTAFQKLVRATSGAINKSAKEAGETEALGRRTTNEVAADAFANSFAAAGQGPAAKAPTMGAVARRGKSGKVVKTEEVSEGDCAKQVLASLAVA